MIEVNNQREGKRYRKIDKVKNETEREREREEREGEGFCVKVTVCLLC